jgi:hypothetical protein
MKRACKFPPLPQNTTHHTHINQNPNHMKTAHPGSPPVAAPAPSAKTTSSAPSPTTTAAAALPPPRPLLPLPRHLYHPKAWASSETTKTKTTCRSRPLCLRMRTPALRGRLSVAMLRLRRTWRWGLMRGGIGSLFLSGLT